ncbi:2-keto-4-pentenoate hydratase/2-oxohepta-3-ene-1,7-dioic acid hydratase in catechol pathway [Paenibacillus shirakamiensis]|uniref:2-keto-4-pentenoate hydratase/2-oxohepta-3-ene-1,7-dioic acid hydratase in catechol pathway n=1 Tax=Paenibacillus shirakamiensis TaxID=1265935 RepID=A0ABS4JHX5_9BACL|nr:fumarylacetoacetate hydrolase family protein [Paenibacillus shirakamiensis]MBP2001319.1 2-keto-4-pentenoate hydratase/2-oxohepta-3-ene-1,7-dioic acid hydratase in catechol pathway [Paenibacillus shirakamiensis]
MKSNVRNVFCVGRNYRLHAAELGNDVPTEPMIFLKPSHAVSSMDGHVLRLPSQQGEIHYEAELVLRIARAYVPGISVDDLVDVMALGIDFTLRDVQNQLKKKGHPWTAAKGFLNSAPITPYQAFPGTEEIGNHIFELHKNGESVQKGTTHDMIFSLQDIVDYIADHYGLDEGDLIFTGTPAGVGPVVAGDQLELFWDGKPLGSTTIGHQL